MIKTYYTQPDLLDHHPVSPFVDPRSLHPIPSTRSSSCLTLSRPPVTFQLIFSNRAISITAPRLWNDLPPELPTISLPPPRSLPITRHHHHLHLAPVSVIPGPSTHLPSPSERHPL